MNTKGFPLLQISFHAPHYVHAFPLSILQGFKDDDFTVGKVKSGGSKTTQKQSMRNCMSSKCSAYVP